MLEVHVPTEWLEFHGRVLADEGEQPVAKATVVGRINARLLVEDAPRETRSAEAVWERLRKGFVVTTADDGRFAIEFAPWYSNPLEISAPGFVDELLWPRRGHDTQATEYEIHLLRPATLRICVVDIDGFPLRGATVRVVSEGAECATARTDGFGCAELLRLWPGHGLHLEVLIDESIVYRSKSAFILGSGERRQLDVQLEARASIVGTLRDESGRRIADHEIWLVEAYEPRTTYFTADTERAGLRGRVRTNGNGEFRLANVLAGLWWVGSAAEQVPGDVRLEVFHVSPGKLVLVESGTEQVSVDLETAYGLTIAGHVMLPDGRPAGLATVMAWSTDALFATECTAALKDGAFDLGPVPPGGLQLKALPSNEATLGRQRVSTQDGTTSVVDSVDELSWCIVGGDDGEPFLTTSEVVPAIAGDAGVVLELRVGGAIQGTVRDGKTGRRLAAEIYLLPSKYGTSWSGPVLANQQDGGFWQDGLAPGDWVLVATTPDNGIAVNEISVHAGGVTQVELKPTPAGQIDVACRWTVGLGIVQVLHKERTVFRAIVQAGESVRVLAPPGRCVVQLRSPFTDQLSEQTVLIQAGVREEVVFSR